MCVDVRPNPQPNPGPAGSGASLEQRPAGGLAALVAAQRGHRMLAAEWEAAWQCGLALEAEAHRALFGAWEGVHRPGLCFPSPPSKVAGGSVGGDPGPPS